LSSRSKMLMTEKAGVAGEGGGQQGPTRRSSLEVVLQEPQANSTFFAHVGCAGVNGVHNSLQRGQGHGNSPRQSLPSHGETSGRGGVAAPQPRHANVVSHEQSRGGVCALVIVRTMIPDTQRVVNGRRSAGKRVSGEEGQRGKGRGRGRKRGTGQGAGGKGHGTWERGREHERHGHGGWSLGTGGIMESDCVHGSARTLGSL
jgi:hypothetical protein